MNDLLPPQAQAYLRKLASALWRLSSDEREAILLELRGHLQARAAAGPEALRAALDGLGEPEALAALYGDDGAGRLTQLPAGMTANRKRMRVGEVIGDVRGTVRASRSGFLLVGALLVTVLTSTNFLLWMAARLPAVGIAEAPATLARLAAVLLAFCAAYRLALSPTAHPWRVDLGTLRFSAATVLAGLLSGAVALAAALGAGALGGAAARAVAVVIALALMSCALLRVQPWMAALAAGRQGFTLRDSWRGTRGRMGNIVKGWLALVLPLYLLHVVLNLLALKLLAFGMGFLALAMADALICTGIVLAATMLNATVLRWATGEAIPAPSAFATETPPESLVDEAQARLRRLAAGAAAQPVRAE
jgi:hypothetical protein